jgi:flagellar basal-body rod protein FlgC
VNVGASASVSGLFAAQTRLAIAANDIANANTTGYRQSRAELTAANPSGVRVQAITQPGDPTAADAPSNTSLAEEMTELIAGKHMYGANAQALRSILELQGQLFDRRV